MKFFKILKWILISVVGLALILFFFGIWFKGQLPPKHVGIENTQAKDLPYLSENKISERGKILIVVTSAEFMGSTNKKTGYELTEVARAYYVFQANGFQVDITSPKGGKAPVVIDDEDMGVYDYAFLNNTVAQQKANNTIQMSKVNPDDYNAVFFAGGKGTMFDFPNNENIQDLVKDYYQTNKVIGAVCHGPSALVNVTLDNGRPLLENKTVSGFTNEEELLLIPDAKTIFPFLLQDKITEQGAKYQKGEMYLEQVSHDGNLITGQNPWSTWKTAETMIQQLGYQPKQRIITDEENAVQVLLAFKKSGRKKAKKLVEQLMLQENKPVNRLLIAKHAIVSMMQGKVGDFVSLVRLVSFIKDCDTKSKE